MRSCPQLESDPSLRQGLAGGQQTVVMHQPGQPQPFPLLSGCQTAKLLGDRVCPVILSGGGNGHKAWRNSRQQIMLIEGIRYIGLGVLPVVGAEPVGKPPDDIPDGFAASAVRTLFTRDAGVAPIESVAGAAGIIGKHIPNPGIQHTDDPLCRPAVITPDGTQPVLPVMDGQTGGQRIRLQKPLTHGGGAYGGIGYVDPVQEVFPPEHDPGDLKIVR